MHLLLAVALLLGASDGDRGPEVGLVVFDPDAEADGGLAFVSLSEVGVQVAATEVHDHQGYCHWWLADPERYRFDLLDGDLRLEMCLRVSSGAYDDDGVWHHDRLGYRHIEVRLGPDAERHLPLQAYWDAYLQCLDSDSSSSDQAQALGMSHDELCASSRDLRLLAPSTATELPREALDRVAASRRQP